MKESENPSSTEQRRSNRTESGAAVRPRSGRMPAPETAPSVAQPKPEAALLLNWLLADEYLLYTKTLNYHWNVRGMQFASLHAFFESHYEELLQIADDVAERVRTVGGTALGSMADFLKHTRLKEQAGFPPDPRGMVSYLLLDHESIIKSLRDGIRTIEDKFDDPGTCNFLTDLLEKHEKLAWMLRTHLDKDLG